MRTVRIEGDLMMAPPEAMDSVVKYGTSGFGALATSSDGASRGK